MSRINRTRRAALLLTVMLLCVPAAQSEEAQDILDVSALTPQQINYKTVEATLGSYVREVSQSASEYFPLTYNVKFDQNNAKFIEFTVKRGQQVKKGDVMARFNITGSEVAFTRMEINLKRTEEDTRRGILDREEAIQKKRSEIAAMSSGYEQEIAVLGLRKLEVELEQYKFRQQRSIDQQREAFEEEKERRANNVLLAPVDGVVSELAYKKADDAVSPGETLAVISSEEVMLLRAKNDRQELRYNMPVRVTMGNGKNQITLNGRVVAADDAIPEKERTGYLFVELEPYDSEEIRVRSPKITGDTVRLDNVIVIQRSAATLEAGKYFVTKLKDGMVQKRFVEFGMGTGQTAWIMTGVEDGETLVLD